MGIKFIDPNQVTKVVSISDEAIDKANSDLVSYQKNYDTSLLKFIEGEVPTYFIIHNVGSSELIQIQQDHYVTEVPKFVPGQEEEASKKVKITPVKTGEMLLRFFKAGCKSLVDGTKTISVNDELMNTIPTGILQEIGGFIMQRSFLPDSKKK